jgi:hypothetical protein
MLAFADPVTWAMIIEFVFWSVFVPAAVAYTLGQLVMSNPDTPEVSPDELKLPTAREGTEYTIIFGTCWIENPVVAWWGDVAVVGIYRHYSVNKWFNNKRVYYKIGHHYAMGAHEILTQGQNDGVKQIKVGKVIVWPDPTNKTVLQADGATSATINHPTAFGGEEDEGGVVGTVDFQYGASSQTPNSYLTNLLGSDICATRGLTGVIKRQVRFGTSPYPKPWAYLIKRTAIHTDGTTQWYPAKATINSYDLNAAHILRECYTNTEWGYSHSTSLFDEATWQAVADTLYDEGFGLSLKWETPNQPLQQFIQNVLRHINGLVYQDPSTGEFVLKLIRDDYVIGSLEEFNNSDIEAVSEFSREGYHHVPDMIWLEYWNRLDNTSVSINNHDIATMNMQGGKSIHMEVRYIGINDDTLASKVVTRERQQLNAFMAPMKIKAKRTMAHLRPGDVFKLTWPPLGISQKVVRVIRPAYGTLKEGYVSFHCAEDVFANQPAMYATPPATGWTSPVNDPAAAPARLVKEAPFWDVYLDGGLSAALALDVDSGFVRIAAKKPSSDTLDYELLLRDSPSDSFYSDGRGFFTPNGTLDSFLPLNAQNAVIDLVDAEDLLSVTVGSYAVIENEIVKVLAVDAGNDQVTIARGCLDTVPAYHSGDDSGGPGARVWFVGSISYIAGREYTATAQPGVKILPRTGKGQFGEGSATAYNADVFDSRMNRPYPPGDFKIDGSSYPATFTGQPDLTWKHRDRTQQISGITEHSATSVGPEAGTTYTLSIYDETGVGRNC